MMYQGESFGVHGTMLPLSSNIRMLVLFLHAHFLFRWGNCWYRSALLGWCSTQNFEPFIL